MDNNIGNIMELTTQDAVNKMFTDNKAKMHIVKDKNYAWIECGKMCYFFHGECKEYMYESMGGNTNKATIIPYDGREIGR